MKNIWVIVALVVMVVGSACNIFDVGGDEEEVQQVADTLVEAPVDTPADTPVDEPPAEPPHISGSSSGGEAGTIGG